MADLSTQRIYRVLMVDDEFMILKGLEKMIDWQELSLELVATATHGQEALAVLQQQTVDIVISDINMPKMNGIEFIEQMKRTNPMIEFIFISGYEKFEYVKSGLSLGASDYLLKPIDKVELYKALAKVKQRIEQNQTLLDTALIQEKQAMSEWFGATYRAIKDTQFSMNTFHFYLLQGEEAQLSLSESPHWLLVGRNQQMVVGLLLDSQKPIKSEIVAHCTVQEPEQAHLLYHHIRQRFRNAPFYEIIEAPIEVQVKYFVEDALKTVRHFHNDYLSQIISEIYAAFEKNQRHKILPLIEQLAQCFRERAVNRSEVHQLLQTFMALNQETSDVLSQTETLSSMVTELIETLRLYSAQVKYDSLHPIVQDALNYIEQNIQEDITLKELSDMFHINVMYLGQLFKRELGQSFSQYLNDLRIDKSKNLLVKTRLSIAEVGNEVGYQNQAYFYRMFKKTVGVSPKEYRQQILDV